MLLALWLMEPRNYRYVYGQYIYRQGWIIGTVLRVLVESVPALLIYYLFRGLFNHHTSSPATYFMGLLISEVMFGMVSLLISGRVLFRLGIIFNHRDQDIM